MSPKVISAAKKVFHIATFAQAALAAYGGLIPPTYAKYGILATSLVSGLLHIITTYVPAATEP